MQGGVNYNSATIKYANLEDHTQDGRIDVSFKGVQFFSGNSSTRQFLAT